MALHLYRSNRSELLVDALHAALSETWPSDPFAAVPVVVGSRGMERWLRHELATRGGITARLAFPFPRQAMDGAAGWLLEGAPAARGEFWEAPAPAALAAEEGAPAPGGEAVFSSEGLALGCLSRLRGHAADADFAAPSHYLGFDPAALPSGPVGARELAFARELGEVLDRLLQDRPAEALAWARAPSAAPERHRWLATLLQELGAASDERSPARLHERLRSEALPVTGRHLFLFGLSSVGPGDRERLEALARGIELHLFLLIPSDRWWQDLRAQPEALRALRLAADEQERQRIESELASQNPLLASLGLPSRDLQAWLEQVGYLGDALPSPDPASEPGEATLLRGLQSWVLRAAGPQEAAGSLPLDASLRLHAAHGPLRQCEVLRDELLALFAAKPDLEPRDVVVMTPDVETYAPLLAGVFARRGLALGPPDGSSAPAGALGPGLEDADASASGERRGRRRLPAIPTAIADLGLRRTNPVAEVMLRLLELAGERLTASGLLDLLALDPVRRRLGLPDADLRGLQDLVASAHFCWGEDAADRRAEGQPELDQNTLRFALERLALGHLMPDEEPLGVVEAAPGVALAPAAPADLPSGEGLQRFAVLAGLGRQLSLQRKELQGPHPLPEWTLRLGRALDALAATSPKAGWLRAEVDARLAALAEQGAPLGDLPVERAALLRWLSGSFDSPQRGDRPITGAVTVCALQPMRSVPFRVVAVLGMDDGVFPRAGRPRTWDPFAERRHAERDPREIDRHLLLEAILSAREHLLVCWTGFEAKRGAAQPAAVPVEELIEVLQGLTGRPRGELVQPHSLQPWSPSNFRAPAPRSHDAAMARAAQALRALRSGGAQPRPRGLGAGDRSPLPPEEHSALHLSLDDVARDLVEPQKALLQGRYHLHLSQDRQALPDREPLELDSLDTWGLRDRILQQLLREPHLVDEPAELLRRAHTRLAAEGVLPLRAGGLRLLRAEVDDALQIFAALGAVAGQLDEPLELSVALPGGPLLVGQVARVRRSPAGELLLEWPAASKEANARARQRAWLHLLAAQAAGHPVGAARTVARRDQASATAAAGTFLAPAKCPEQALAILRSLFEVWGETRRQALELFKRSSPKLAEALHAATAAPGAGGAPGAPLAERAAASPQLRAELAAAARKGWVSDAYNPFADDGDPWIQTLFPDYDPTEHLEPDGPLSLLGLAERVWLPVVAAEAAGKELAAHWAAASGAEGGEA